MGAPTRNPGYGGLEVAVCSPVKVNGHICPFRGCTNLRVLFRGMYGYVFGARACRNCLPSKNKTPSFAVALVGKDLEPFFGINVE